MVKIYFDARKLGALCLGIALFTLFAVASTARAASVDIVAREVNGDVVFTANGAFDVTGLTRRSTVGAASVIAPDDGLIQFGGSGDLYEYDALTIFDFGGSGFPVADLANTGDLFGFDPRDNIRYLMLPRGHTDGTITSSMTFTNETFLSLRLTANFFETITFSNGQTVSLRIGDAPVVPLPAALPMLLTALGGLGLAARRRKRA